ncbi:TlpA family protein disulfide reductase [Natronolimnohabitans sp. A-GB9]|uniref:TlpA family protein disulfide reductase n=1 Tax=Natronolimnohabitans sp. A-GB9 TaxID=3069757 RepID=UPI0027B538D3|nr:TlpA family protein disulfide reductase [Natronolimnohabitans sp. A-GB9]MDQ2050437.1 TlpA family protein disulfide reductase [Natronolimnohabitans sp. A-GB9]
MTAVTALSGCLDGLGSSDEDEQRGTGDEDAPPFEVQTVDAPGSDAGTVAVPTDGQVQLINHIRLECPTSRAMLSRVDEAVERLEDDYTVGPDGDVLALSVIDATIDSDPTPSELADWWAEHGGDWTIGIDEVGSLFDHHDVTGTPTTVAVDGDGEIHWRDEGGTTARNLVSGVESALEAERT